MSGFVAPSAFQPAYGSTSPFRSYLRSQPATPAPQQTPPPQSAPTPTPAASSPVVPALAGYVAGDYLTSGAAPAVASSIPSALTTAGTAGAAVPTSGLVGSEAANLAFNTPALESANVLWNAPATEATIAANSAAGAAATSPWSLSGIGSGGNLILPIAGAVGAGDLLMRQPGGARGAIQGAASGAAMGSYFGPQGALIGAGIGAVTGGLMRKSGKSGDQLTRDSMRQALKDAGYLGQDNIIQLANGSAFDMGMDGHAALPNYDGKTSRPYYQWDPTSPLSHQAIGWINPIAEVIAGKNEKVKTDLAGYLVNAVTTGTTTLEGVRANVLGLMQQYGFDEQSMRSAIDEMMNAGEITPEEREAYQYGIGTLMLGDSSRYEYGDPVNNQIVNVSDAGTTPAQNTPTNPPEVMLQPPSSVTPNPGNPTPVTRMLAQNINPMLRTGPVAPPLLPTNLPMDPNRSRPLQITPEQASNIGPTAAPAPSPTPAPMPMPGRTEAPQGMRPLLGPQAPRGEDLRIRPIGIGIQGQFGR